MSAWRLWWQQVWAITIKELLTTFKDPRSRIVLIIPVFVQGFLFGYAATYNLNRVPYVYVDESHSQRARDFIDAINHTGIFTLKEVLESPSQIASRIESGEAIMAIVIPQNFDSQLSNRSKAEVQLITDGKNSMTAGLTTAYMTEIAQQFNHQQLGLPDGPVNLSMRTWFNPNLQSSWTFLPGLIGLVSMTQVLMLAGLSVARERENGTFDQLLVTPVSSWQIMIAKSIPSMIIGLFQSTVLLGLSVFWFQVPFSGSLLILYAVLIVFVLSSIGIGLSISAIANNMQQVLVYVFVLLLPLALLSGLATPVHNMPESLQVLTYANPMRFALDAIRRVYLEGVGMGAIIFDFIPMLVMTFVTMVLAAWLFRNKVV